MDWNLLRRQEQQNQPSGPFARLDQLPKGARVEKPVNHGQMQQQAPPSPEQVEHIARIAMAQQGE